MASKAEIERHSEIWGGFVRFVTLSTVGVVIALGLMALFLV